MIKLTLLIVAFVCFITICNVIVVSASTDSALHYSGTQKNWMSRLGDEKRLFIDVTVPGTHDSGSYVFSTAAAPYQCQAENITKQLEAGVRFLDIRMAFIWNDLRVVYGPSPTYDYTEGFDSVLEDITNFLSENKDEVVIMRLKKVFKATGVYSWKQDLAEDVFERFNASRDFACQNASCTLGPSRGKIIYLEDDPVAPRLGFLNYSEIFGIQQNDWLLTGHTPEWDKWVKARDMMIRVSKDDRNTGAINYFSASDFPNSPYRFATGDPPMSIIMDFEEISPEAPKYIDFSPHQCKRILYKRFDTKYVVEIVFRGMNNMLYEWLKNGRLGEPQSREVPYVWPRRLGVLVLDFPNNTLLDEIIAVNFAHSNPFKGKEYIPFEEISRSSCPELNSCIAGDVEIATEGRGTVAARDVAVGDRIPGLLAGEWCEVVTAARVRDDGIVFGNFTSDHLVVDVVEAENLSQTYVLRPNGAEAPARNVDLVNIATVCPVARTVSGELFTPISMAICTDLTWGQYNALYSAFLRVVAKTGTFWFDPLHFSAARGASPLSNAAQLLLPVATTDWSEDLPDICSAMTACAADGLRCDEFEQKFADWMRQHIPPEKYALIARVYPNFGNPNASHGRILDDVRRS